MKLAVFSPVFGNKTLEEALRYLSSKGVDGMELGAGGYPGKAHADILELKKDAGKRAALKDLFAKYNMEICALSVHGNGVHPQAPLRGRRPKSWKQPSAWRKKWA